MYASLSAIRRYAKDLAVETVDLDDTALTAFSNEQSVPEIDAALRGRGAPFTGTAPAIIQKIDAMWTAGAAITYIYRRLNPEKTNLGDGLIEAARKMLDDVVSGVLDAGGQVQPAAIAYGGDGNEDLPETSVFVRSDAIKWRARSEEREA